MSDFSLAITAVKMALEAFHLDGQINVEINSDTQTITLDKMVYIASETYPPGGPNWVTATVDFDPDHEESGELTTTPDVTDAVAEAVSYLIAARAKEFLSEIFEEVLDDVN